MRGLILIELSLVVTNFVKFIWGAVKWSGHCHRDQQDQIWIIETENEVENVWVSITKLRPRLRRSESQWQDQEWKCLSLNNKTETEKMWILMTRLRLQMCESQLQDRDWKIWVSMTRPRLEKSESQKQDWTKDANTETPSRLLLISDFPLVGRGMIFAPWNKFYMRRVF